MANQNKIIIGLLVLVVIVLVSQIVLDYLKIERKYRACSEQCKNYQITPEGIRIFSLYGLSEWDICVLECQEKYGK